MAEPLRFHLEYIPDDSGANRAVVLQIEDFEELLEDLHDLAVVVVPYLPDCLQDHPELRRISTLQ